MTSPMALPSYCLNFLTQKIHIRSRGRNPGAIKSDPQIPAQSCRFLLTKSSFRTVKTQNQNSSTCHNLHEHRPSLDPRCPTFPFLSFQAWARDTLGSTKWKNGNGKYRPTVQSKPCPIPFFSSPSLFWTIYSLSPPKRELITTAKAH